ncbi:MAG: molybdopterin-binding protein [Clostridiales Family XIII bacterium]|jgi:molybdenum cofactor synthesis domain-containing protein|nr:molybdopterin-binding protein [Clostridiales Family XIII bacterium]
MKEIRTQDAVGHIISHDITRIIPGGAKDVAFQKGHIVREEDIPELLKIGKAHLFVWENDGTMLHENDAAQALADIVCGDGFVRGDVKEGKIEIFAGRSGILRVDKEKLAALNAFDEIMVATRHDLSPVRAGDKLAGTRIIPLAISKDKMEEAGRSAGEGAILSVLPYIPRRTAIITTGSEVFEGLVEDGFTPVVRKKLADYETEDIGHLTVPDNPEMATNAILRMVGKGADVVFVTGGMSVDPDDRTPLAIKNTGADVVSYGAPVLPGAMFLVAYLGDTAILGLPGCVMHSKRTILDIVLPRVMAGLRITKRDINDLAPGGLCLSCEVCIFPACGFGAL